MGSATVTTDTLLVVRSRNSLSGLVLTVVGRVLDAGGKIRSFEFQHTPNTDRSQAEQTHALISGQLLDVAVTPKTGTPRRGQCYVTLGLALRVQPTTSYYELLAKGYVTAEAGLIWPGGLYSDSVEGPGWLRRVAGTDRVAGAQVGEPVPTNARWRLSAFYAVLVTDATVATRAVYLSLTDGTNLILSVPANATQAASTTRGYQFVAGVSPPAAVAYEIYFPWPFRVTLFQGWAIATITSSMAAGDDWGAPQIDVEEWIEE